ncbi:MAG: hypothetical protein R6U96_08205 [Promethearchaeia archaeon]
MKMAGPSSPGLSEGRRFKNIEEAGPRRGPALLGKARATLGIKSRFIRGVSAASGCNRQFDRG